ncbi:adhesion G-protein coupled receptor G6-like [Octopus vulgaris]|uniref:Adhesion G-protein coupled receptor G6-like n=1 Tax=Octopus vulgaris TaxID=6645 RepID=A0AA36C002_OCTVU|nr:adhesion G-protein coupled receptor G6-like [Octopus vulgaris]
MMYIQPGVFENLPNLEKLSFVSNGIQISENGAFLFLPRIIYIDFSNNRDMMCGCHLPALVNYVKTKFKRHMKVEGKCQADIGNNQTKVIPIMEYSQCKNYSLFQRNLLCQTCSGMKCNESEVTHCTGDEPVCQFKLSMDGIKLKFEKSCSTFRKCDDAMKNNTLTCNELTSGSTCVACCIGNLCNKKDFRGWSNSFVFPLISSSTFKFNESEGLAENISRAMEHELSNLTGNFEVQYCGYDDREAFTITCTVPRTITKDQIFKQISEIFKTSQILRDLGLQHRNMELFDEMLCNENTTSINGTFHWPMTKIGTNVTIPCHANVATRYCSSGKMEYSETPTSQYVKSPKCSPFTGVWKEPDMSQCYNTEGITQQLENITSEDINEENVEEISTIVRDISKKAKYFKAEDIDLAVDIQEKMVPLISNVSTNITLNNILPSINDMIDTPEEILMEAEQSGGTGSRMLDIIEAIPEEIPLEGQQLTALNSNLGIGAIKVEKDTFNGAVFGISFGNNETEAKTMIHNNSDTSPQAKMSIDFISLPRVLLSRLNSNERSNVSRITFLSLKDDKLYRVKQNSSAKANTTIISNIIAANVPNVQIMDLDQPVTISVGLTEKNPGNLRCVYWDETLGQEPHWSTKGCNTSTYVPGEKMICSCDHLTSFAVLMEIYAIPAHGNTSHLLYKTSYIGCGISLACLLFTVIFYVCSKYLRKLMPSKILINMCISLAITNVIFLAGMRPYDSEKAACKAVAALLHFFILTSLMWTAVEALHIFVRMPSFMIKSSIAAWGLPAAIVAITLAINHTNNYIRIADVCWLSKVSFYVAFLAPVVAILLFNFIVIFLAICRRSSKKSDEQSEHEIKKMRVFGIFSVTFLFVLSWVIAFIAEEEGVGVFHILFIIFNILLGMFIFIFYCIYKKDARDAISSYAMRANKSSRSSNKTDVGTVEKRT